MHSMNTQAAAPKARIIKANHLLQAKVGTGQFEAAQVAHIQKKMESLTYDFAPLAQVYMEDLQAAILKAEKGDASRDDLIRPVMELKANAPMFGYALIGDLAHIILTLLETAPKTDDDVLEIVSAQYKTLDIILKNTMRGDGGDYGTQLQNELQEACNRYYSKNNLQPITSDNNDLD